MKSIIKNFYDKYFTYKNSYEENPTEFSSFAKQKNLKMHLRYIVNILAYLAISLYFILKIYHEYTSSFVCMYAASLLLCLICILGVCIHSVSLMRYLLIITAINALIFIVSSFVLLYIALLFFTFYSFWSVSLGNSIRYYNNLSY